MHLKANTIKMPQSGIPATTSSVTKGMAFFTFCAMLFLSMIPGRPAGADARPQPVRVHETLMEIPEIKALTSSEAHLYVLSGREGLVVFRTGSETLQWLYSSSGLSNRGNRLITDIRFSYLFGRDSRLTVIEPTSVLGVYSSTRLAGDPNDMVRIGNDLFIADGETGLLRLSLKTPESVDRNPETAFSHNRPILSVDRISSQLFALDNQARLMLFEYEDGKLAQNGSFQLPRGASLLHVIANRLYMTTSDGTVYRIRPDGRSDELFRIDEPVTGLERWNENYLIRGESSRIWIARQGMRPTLFREDPSAGNHITAFKNQLWISEHRQLSRWDDAGLIASMPDAETERPGDASTPGRSGGRGESLRIAPVSDRVIPYPRPLLMPLSLESGHNISEVNFQQRSRIDAIRIRGNGLYWQPSSSDIGSHAITIIASTPDGQTDSTSFSITVRPFNSPPRFSPVRTISIPVDEEFTIPIQATDPDGSDAGLIRYIGVDLPDGAALDEHSGRFRWTPSRRQTGEHEFQVIATDQYGAASSLNVTVEVIDLSRGD
jgi:hypothetical protein